MDKEDVTDQTWEVLPGIIEDMTEDKREHMGFCEESIYD